MNAELITIIDASGSMAGLRVETVSGYNKFLDDQRAVPGECKASLVTFNALVTPVYSGVPLPGVMRLHLADYMPNGYTALRDAIGGTLEREGRRIAQERWAEKVIVCIITDGAENSSRYFTIARLSAMIKHAEAHGWSFVYLAANVDAFATGASMGISEVYTSSFQATRQGVSDSYANYGATASSLRADPNAGGTHG